MSNYIALKEIFFENKKYNTGDIIKGDNVTRRMIEIGMDKPIVEKSSEEVDDKKSEKHKKHEPKVEVKPEEKVEEKHEVVTDDSKELIIDNTSNVTVEVE